MQSYSSVEPYSATDMVNETSYTYSINIPINSDVGTATLEFSFDLFGTVYTVITTGDISILRIDENYTLIQGILKGVLNIGGENYTVKACLSKLASQDTISVGVALIPADYYTNEESTEIFFCFGTSVMTEEFTPIYLDYINNRGNTDSPNDVTDSSSISTNATNATPTFISSKLGYFKPSHFHDSNGYAILLKVYRDSSNKRFYLKLGSYTGNLSDSHFPNHHVLSVGISEYTVGLKRLGTDTSISSMEGVTGIGGSNSSRTAALGKIIGGFIEIASAIFDVPASFLSSLFEDTRGTGQSVHMGDESYVNISAGAPAFTFDTDANQFPVGFNIQVNGNTGCYQGYANMTYLVTTSESILPVDTKTVTTSNVYIS